MARVTQEGINRINELYKQYHNYAKVARETGYSPATVKKYVVDEPSIDESNFVRWNGALPEFDPSLFRTRDWGSLCELTDQEMHDVRELWKEILC